MHDTFSPEERIQNILYVIKELNELMHECDSRFTDLYLGQLKAYFTDLGKAVSDLKAND